MKRLLFSILIISTISFLTAYLILNLINGKSKKTSVPIKEIGIQKNDRMKSNQQKLDLPQIDKTTNNKNQRINDTINTLLSEVKIENADKIVLYNVEQAEIYIGKTKNKSISTLNYHLKRLKKIYNSKFVSDEAKELVKKTIYLINKEIIKVSTTNDIKKDSVVKANIDSTQTIIDTSKDK